MSEKQKPVDMRSDEYAQALLDTHGMTWEQVVDRRQEPTLDHTEFLKGMELERCMMLFEEYLKDLNSSFVQMGVHLYNVEVKTAHITDMCLIPLETPAEDGKQRAMQMTKESMILLQLDICGSPAKLPILTRHFHAATQDKSGKAMEHLTSSVISHTLIHAVKHYQQCKGSRAPKLVTA